MKYVMIEKDLGDGMVQIIPVIFPNTLVHSDVSEAIGKVAGGKCKAVTAGEVNISVHHTHGRSESLGVLANRADAVTIELADYNQIREKS